MTLAGVSLIAAIPAAVVTLLMVLVFLQHTDKASVAMLGVVGVTMLASATVALMPVGIVLFGGAPRGAKAANSEETSGSMELDATTMEVSGEIMPSGEFEMSGEFDLTEDDK